MELIEWVFKNAPSSVMLVITFGVLGWFIRVGWSKIYSNTRAIREITDKMVSSKDLEMMLSIHRSKLVDELEGRFITRHEYDIRHNEMMTGIGLVNKRMERHEDWHNAGGKREA